MDAFNKQRAEKRVLSTTFEEEPIEMVLGYKDVRRTAKDWKTFSSDGAFQVPIPSEAEYRSVRQLPIETNPDEHSEYRKIVEPFFKRPLNPAFIGAIEDLISEMVDEACNTDSVEIVSEFALPLQSIALSHLINMPQKEADIWIKWGTNVFLDGGDVAIRKGADLEQYLHDRIDNPGEGENIFKALNEATYQDRLLTKEEKLGFMNLVFAGGRDTIIHSVSSIIHYFSQHPEKLAQLDDDKSVIIATEELFRAFSPITQIGRVCPVDTDLHGVNVPAGNRVSLCWASANFDPNVFETPEEVNLERKPNQHIAFGSGVHNCLGAAHARLLMRTLVKILQQKKVAIEVISADPHTETNPQFTREVGFDKLLVKMQKSQ